MKLDELFAEDEKLIDQIISEIEKSTGMVANRDRASLLRKKIHETKEKIRILSERQPADTAEKQMRFWIKMHLTKLKDKKIVGDENPISFQSIARGLNRVAYEMGFAEVDPTEQETLTNLIMNSDGSMPEFIEKIEDGHVFLNDPFSMTHREIDQEKAEDETTHIDKMAKGKAKKDIKDKDKGVTL